MPSDGKGQGLVEVSGANPGPNPNPSPKPDPASVGSPAEEKAGPHHVITVVVEEKEAPAAAAAAAAAAPKILAAAAVTMPEKEERANVAAAKKGCLTRSDSCHEECRICQQPTEEPLIVLGCRCRGELAKAHRSCIDIWFRSKGSNKCEICQQVAANVPSPVSQPSTNYWVWRVESAYGGANIGRGNHERRCFSPLWVAFAILIGGLLLDVLISVSLGVSALPVNIIIGVLIVLGLGTAFRLTMECCQEWGSRRNVERVEVNVNPGFQPAV